MADNIQINAGSGPAVKTDDVAGEHFQVVKLADGTSESATPIAAGEGVKERALRVVLPTDAGDVKVTLDSEAVNLGATDTGHLAAIETAVELIDDAISGTEMQVDVVAALPAGTNNIGDVDVASLPGDVAAADGGAYGKGVLIQGDDGTDRRAVLVGTDGHVQVDVLAAPAIRALTNADVVTAELSAVDNAVLDSIAAAVATEGDALGDGVLIQGDDGTDRTNVLVDTDGHLQVDVVSGGGGGTQYTEGDTDATITGTAMLMEGAGDGLVVVPGTAAGGVLVNLGANNDVAVSGTVTAELSATDNAVLDAIQAAVEKLDDAVAGSELQVDVVSSALPAGAATEATLAAVDGHVDGIEALLGTMDADTSALAGCVGGTELQADVVSSALPAGAATAAKQDTIIGHVDGIETVLGTIDGDTSALAGCVGGTEVQVDVVTAPAVRALTNADVVTAELSATDNAVLDAIAASLALLDNSIAAGNELQCDIVSSALPTGAATEATLASVKTAVETLDNAIAGTEMQCDIVGSLPAGTAAIGKLAANSGVDIGDVDVTSVVPGVAATNLGKAEDAAHSSGDVGVMALAIRDDTIGAFSGAEGDYEPLHTDAVGRLYVNAQGPVAHDGTAAGNPVLLGAEALSAERAAVATTDVAKLVCDLVGKLITLPYAIPELFVKGKTAAITDTTRTAVIAAQGAGVKLYITHIAVTNSHATVGTYVKIEDDTTEIYGGYAAAAGGGFSYTLPVPLVITANKALNVSCGTTGANVYACASGYKGA